MKLLNPADMTGVSIDVAAIESVLACAESEDNLRYAPSDEDLAAVRALLERLREIEGAA